MPFFKSLFLAFLLTIPAVVFAAGIEEAILTKELGSCATNNLAFTAMKFYKIPLNENTKIMICS